MAITFSTDMLYTRTGASQSNVLSAHDPLIWKFADGAIAANPTATVQIVVKNNAGSTIYTSAIFPAYLLSYSAPTATFRFDASQIVKHIINNYFYKSTTGIVEAENYGSKIEVTFKSYDNAVLEDTKLKEYFASHALNQIGDEYGSNIPRLFLNDTEDITHHMGFPNHLFFYAPATLAAYSPLVEIFKDEPSNLITSLSNGSVNPYSTFTVTGTVVNEAIATNYSCAKSGQTFPIIAGENYEIIVPNLSYGSAPPSFFLALSTNETTLGSNKLACENGDNALILTVHANMTARLYFDLPAGSVFECGAIQVRKVIDASIQGTLGLYMHSVDLAQLIMTKDVKTLKVYYNLEALTLIKTYNLTIFEPAEDSVYVRFLTKDGYYMYWAFTPYKVSTTEGEKMNSVINSFAEMALANSRNYPIGYKNSFNKIVVSAASVPIVFQRRLMEMFISPAVYLWQGGQTPGENLMSTVAFSTYDTLEHSGTIILSAINAGGFKVVQFHPLFQVAQDENITVVLFLTLNSGELPDIYLYETAAISNSETLSAGFNLITLTATKASDSVSILIDNDNATNFSTSRIVVKRKEVEADWILLDKVEGSHNLREKNNFDSFNATLVLPENYTQTLGRVDV